MFGRSEECDIPGETVKIFCEANPHYYLTAREYDDVVLLPGDESNPHQQWIMDCTWGTKVRDRTGSPAFALVNKATRQALRHGHELNEKVNISPYSKEEFNEAVLWTQSDDVGNGYKCIRPVDNTDLNLDANHGDKESGGIRDGTDLILFKWKKHENQKWKVIPIMNKVSQVEHYGGVEDEGVTKYAAAPCDEPTYGSGTTGYGGGAPYGRPGLEEEANYARHGHDEGKNYDRPGYEEGTKYGRPGYEEGTKYGRPGYEEGPNYGRPGYKEGANYGRPDDEEGTNYGRPGYEEDTKYGRPGYEEGTKYGRPDYEEGTKYGRPGYEEGTKYGRPDYEEGSNYGRPSYKEGTKYGRPDYEEGTNYDRPSYEEVTNYGHPGYKESTNYGEGPAQVIRTHHHNDFPEGTSYEEAPAHDFRMPEGQLVKIYCEQSPDFFLTVHNQNVVLASADVDDISQHWIKVDEWGTKVRDESGFPAFALVNKANLKALKHGTKEWDKVELKHYDANDLDESILWTQSADVGHGYQCIRPVSDINLNLDAKLADGKYGNIEDGSELILFKWKKQKNQKWKMLPVNCSKPFIYGCPAYEEGTTYGRPSYEEGTTYKPPSYEEATNYGHSGYQESTNYGGGTAQIIHTHHHNDFPEGTSYEEGPAYDFCMPEGQIVKIYCEQSLDFFLTVGNQNVVLAPGVVDDISQHWIKVDEWGTKARDEAGFPAFALVNKANLKALKHGSKEWDKVELKHYDAHDLDESILWTQSADVGHGYQCIRPVSDINLNLDAKLADGKYGNVEDGNELILFKWKKQKNQKWKMLPVYCK